MTYVRRDQLTALLRERGDLPLVEALAALDLPLGLLNVTLDPEDWFVVGQRIFDGGQSVAAGGAGNRSQSGVFNQSTVGGTNPGLVVVEGVIVHAVLATTWEIRALSSGLGGGAVGFLRDLRFGATARTQHALMTSGNSSPVQGTQVGFPCSTPANDSFLIPYPFVLGPGTARVLGPSVDNQAINAWFWGRELDLRQR